MKGLLLHVFFAVCVMLIILMSVLFVNDWLKGA